MKKAKKKRYTKRNNKGEFTSLKSYWRKYKGRWQFVMAVMVLYSWGLFTWYLDTVDYIQNLYA